MNRKKVTEIIAALGQDTDEKRWAELRRYAGLTALKRAPDGSFHYGHWWRGPLLYSLVTALKPGVILETGTGRGYGTLCAAKAAADAGLPTRIYTVDVTPPDARMEWPIDEGKGPEVRQLSVDEVWRNHFPPFVTDRIHVLTGTTREILGNWSRKGLPGVDFAFIDAGHAFRDAKQDLVSALAIANANCGFLFDDFTDRKGYGVGRLLQNEIAPRLPEEAATILDMEAIDHVGGGKTEVHLMALVDGSAIGTATLRRFYTPAEVLAFRTTYPVWTALAGLRRVIARLLSAARN